MNFFLTFNDDSGYYDTEYYIKNYRYYKIHYHNRIKIGRVIRISADEYYTAYECYMNY